MDKANEIFQFDVESYLNNESPEVQAMFEQWIEAHRLYDEGSDEAPLDVEFDLLESALFHAIQSDDFKQKLYSVIYRNEYFMTSHGETELISLFKIKFEENKFRVAMNSVFDFFKLRLVPDIFQNTDLVVAPKFDGCSLKVMWELGSKYPKLIQTRGGLDVTDLLKTNKSILQSASLNRETVCGEFIIKRKTFEDKYGDEYRNPRNFVGSLVKRKTLSQDIIDDIDFIPYSDGINPIGEYWNKPQKTPADYYYDVVQHLPYECDGIVIAESKTYTQRPVKDNYPLNMVACKFPSPTAMSDVIDIEWTQKKTGNLIPTIIFKPVDLCGSVIQKAAGFNYENIKSNGIGIGASILVTKSGDIIPYVKKVIRRSDNIPLPDVEFYREGKNLVSQDDQQTKIFKFVNGFKVLQIQGIGEGALNKIGEVLSWNILNAFNSSYKLDIINILGSGSVWQNFSRIYTDIKTLTLNQLIELLQFRNVGPKVAYKIALLLTKQSNDKSHISDDVLSLFTSTGNGTITVQNAIAKLKEYGIQVIKPIQVTEDTITYEMSGSPSGFTKQEFEKRLKQLCPNAIHTTLTKTTKYLFVDDIKSNSSKVNKARKYNVKILTYEDVLKNGIPQV